MKRYSQSNEQDYILEYFKGATGSFLDIGCNDCETFSNTRALAELGWSGVFIDASPTISKCRDLYNKRRGFYVYENAVGAPHPLTGKPFNGKVVFNDSGSIINGKDSGLVGTFYQDEMNRFKKITDYKPIEVKTYKWKTQFNRLRIKEFKFISMDVEGSELNILPDMDLSNTSLLCIEHNGSEERKNNYLYYTKKYGIDRIIYESGENLLIAR